MRPVTAARTQPSAATWHLTIAMRAVRTIGVGIGLLAVVGCGDPRRDEGVLSGGGGPGGGDTTPGTSDGADDGADTAAAEEGDSSSGGGDSESDEGSAIFDVGTPSDDDGGSPCDGADDFEFSNIWIANSTEGTVSKLGHRHG